MKYRINRALDSARRLPLRLFYAMAGRIYHHDERVAMYLYTYFPSYRSAFVEAMNQFHRVLGSDSSLAAQGIVVEPTNICNLRCRHCTPQNVPGEKGYMDFSLFKKIIDENPQLTSMILTRNGEPFLHPRIFDMIRYARGRSIYVNIYTNGLTLNAESVDEILSSGLNELNFSMEGVGEFYRYNRGKDYAALRQVIESVLKERKERSSPLKVGINIVVTDDAKNIQDVMREWRGVVDHVTVEPLMGGRASERRYPCRTIWRNLVVSWNGDTTVCCSDIEDRLKIGNAGRESLAEIFNSPEARRLRRRHLSRDFPPMCKHCDSHFG